MSGITRDDWLSALKDATTAPLPDTDALSLREFADMLGVERSAAERRLKTLMALGKAERTKKQIRRNDGAVILVPAYRLISPGGGTCTPTAAPQKIRSTGSTRTSGKRTR